MKRPLLREPVETIGGAAGNVVVPASSVTTRIRKGVGRIPTKDKARLPRLQKKALKNATLTSPQ
jgi:hypothetical protein